MREECLAITYIFWDSGPIESRLETSGSITLQYGYDLNFASCSSRESIFEQLKGIEPDVKFSGESVSAVHQLINQMKVGDIVILSHDDRTFQAIGRVSGDYEHTRKFEERTYHQTRPVDWLITYEDNQPWHRVSRKKFSQRLLHQLDPSMLRPNELTNLLADDSRHHPENYVLIIDEIGRGDVAEIFGELITLIDADKRAGASNPMSVLLPGSGESFEVPGNLYIIGTLNAADQISVLRNGALRRRFEFEELIPDASLIRGDDQLGTIPDGNRGRIDLRSLMNTVNRRIEFIYDRDKILGPAFFMNIATFEDIVRALHHQIIPQLQEICDGDWHRIQLIFKDVLGDGQPNHPQIVAHEWQTSCNVLGIEDADLEDQARYWIVPVHELAPGAIRKVYSDS